MDTAHRANEIAVDNAVALISISANAGLLEQARPEDADEMRARGDGRVLLALIAWECHRSCRAAWDQPTNQEPKKRKEQGRYEFWPESRPTRKLSGSGRLRDFSRASGLPQPTRANLTRKT